MINVGLFCNRSNVSESIDRRMSGTIFWGVVDLQCPGFYFDKVFISGGHRDAN